MPVTRSQFWLRRRHRVTSVRSLRTESPRALQFLVFFTGLLSYTDRKSSAFGGLFEDDPVHKRVNVGGVHWWTSFRKMCRPFHIPNIAPIRPLPRRTTPKVGRNDPCPCGSGTVPMRIHPGTRAKHSHQQGFLRHFQREHGNVFLILDRGIFSNVHGKGCFSHRGPSGKNNQIRGLQNCWSIHPSDRSAWPAR
jgi:hypothetical protein